METQNIKMEKAAVRHEAKVEVYDRLIQNSQNLDKEHLLELFALTIEQIKIQDKQLFDVIYASKNENLADSYSNITQTHINNIDGIGDRIITKNNQINTEEIQNPENVLPSNVLM